MSPCPKHPFRAAVAAVPAHCGAAAQPPEHRRRRMLAAGLLLPVLMAAGTLAGCDSKPQGAAPVIFNSVDITGATYAQGLNLPDADGHPRTLAEFKGKVVVVFFGYTHCPDVCPLTMTEVLKIKKALGPDGERLVAVFVTLDPQRDEPKLLKAYVQNFDPSFVALRGTPEQTAEAARAFKVFYEKVPGRDGASYTLDHTAGSYVFDPQGRIRLFARFGQEGKGLEADIRALLAGA